jgi:hypothetical protein
MSQEEENKARKEAAQKYLSANQLFYAACQTNHGYWDTPPVAYATAMNYKHSHDNEKHGGQSIAVVLPL